MTNSFSPVSPPSLRPDATSERDSRSHIVYSSGLMSITMAAFLIIKTGRDAAFFVRGDSVGLLPSLMLWGGLMALPVAMAHLHIMKRLGSRAVRVGVYLFASALFMAFAPAFDAGWSFILLLVFPMVSVYFAALFASSWLLAAELLGHLPRGMRQTAYARLAAASTVGGVIGSGFASLIAPHLTSIGLIRSGAVLLCIGGLVAYRAQKVHSVVRVPRAEGAADVPSVPTSVVLQLLRPRRTRIMALISILAAAIGVLVEFQFYASAAQSGAAGRGFFAGFYLLLSLSTLAIQLVVVPLLQAQIGAKVLLVLPLGVLGGISMIFLPLGLWTRTAARLIESTLRSAVHRASWEQLYVPIETNLRGPTKAFVDGAVARMTEAAVAAALLLYIHPLEGAPVELSMVTAAAGALAVLWLGMTALLVNTERCLVEPGEVAPPDCACQATSPLGEKVVAEERLTQPVGGTFDVA